MRRTYLEEDAALIQKYFPGAKTVALHTPFDLTRKPKSTVRLSVDNFHDIDSSQETWHGGVLWMG